MSPPTRGGGRPGAGRPHAYREPLQRVTVTLPASYIEQLRRYGGDNLSGARWARIRRLVEEARAPTGDFWYVMPEWAQPTAPAKTAAASSAPATPASRTIQPEVAME